MAAVHANMPITMCDLSLVGVMLLTKIPLGTYLFPLIELGSGSDSCRQLLVKSSYGAYGRQSHCGMTLICLHSAKNQTHASSQEVAD